MLRRVEMKRKQIIDGDVFGARIARFVRSGQKDRGSLSCNNPVDPLHPLAVMASGKMAAHMPAGEDKKLAPHHAALITNTGIKRRPTEEMDMTRLPYQSQKKVRRDEQEIEGERETSQNTSITAGLPTTGIEEISPKNEEGHMDNEGLERIPDSQKGKMAVEDKEES